MTITKYEHACLVVSEGDNQKLIIDPGMFSSSLTDYSDVVGVVVTHSHADHWTPEQLRAIVGANPEARIFTTTDAAGDMSEFSSNLSVVEPGTTQAIGSFNLDFYGGTHALIHSTIPQIKNLGLMVNNRLYYPGDSFAVPDKPVEILAIPVSAPWLKLGEAMDFVQTIKPKQAFATHNSLLNDAGLGLADRLLGFCETFGTSYLPLTIGVPVTL